MVTLTTRSHQHHFEILKHGGNWVDLLTPQNPTDKLRSLGLTECTTLTSLKDLLTTELVENWGTLQHHSLHPSWQKVHSNKEESAQQTLSGSPENEDRSIDQKRVHLRRHDVLRRDVDSDKEEENAEKCKGTVKCDKQGSVESTESGGERVDSGWFARYVSLFECGY